MPVRILHYCFWRFRGYGKFKTPMEHAIALYSYEGLTEQELSFSKNDVFKILDRENQDWWFVESETQKQGYVPTTYVKPYEDKIIQLDSEHEGRQDIQVDSEPEDPQEGQDSDDDDDDEHHMDNAEHGKLI